MRQELCQVLYMGPLNISGNGLRYCFHPYFVGKGRNRCGWDSSVFTVCKAAVEKAVWLRVHLAGLQS